ncbi:MAG: phage late control D family protein, partial [Pseudomonadota bacterium]|nr:phage late control D family protein [Pseudomonadota bacterium]
MNDALGDVGEDLVERLQQGVGSMFTQAGAGGGHIELTVDGLTLDAYALHAESSLSELGEYRIFCAAGAGLEAGSLLGKGAEWRCISADGLERDNVGQVIRIEQGRLLPDGREEWVFTVTSSLAALQQQRRHRIVHRRTVIELAKELLGEYGLTVDNRTREQYPVMEWTAQVGETDLHFLQRLLARHGIWFYSLKGEKGEILVLADDPHGASRADRGQLDVIPETGGSRSQSGSTTVALRQTRQYYRWQPDRNRVHQQVCPSEFDAHTEISQSAERKQTTQQTFFEAGSGDAHDSLTRARLETERQACRAHTLRVAGAVGDLQPGQWLPIEGQGPCLVTRATLTFSAPRNHQGNTPQGFVWEAELLPLSQPYRPVIPTLPALPLVF